jgi:hypothetical protein
VPYKIKCQAVKETTLTLGEKVSVSKWSDKLNETLFFAINEERKSRFERYGTENAEALQWRRIYWLQKSMINTKNWLRIIIKEHPALSEWTAK